MGAVQIPSGSSDNWEQIAATNPAATTLNFNSITGYKKLIVTYASSATTLSSLRFNSDSGTKYYYSSTSNNTTSLNSQAGANTSATQTGASVDYLQMKIESVDTSNLKEYSGTLATSSGTALYNPKGIYQASAPITSINFTWSSTFNSTVYLYGVRA